MPGMDGRGPAGEGPMTGRGLGRCTKDGEGTGWFGRGLGRGLGRGMGRRIRGFGQRIGGRGGWGGGV